MIAAIRARTCERGAEIFRAETSAEGLAAQPEVAPPVVPLAARLVVVARPVVRLAPHRTAAQILLDSRPW